MTEAHDPGIQDGTTMRLQTHLWPGGCQTGIWPGIPAVQFGWTLEWVEQSAVATISELCRHLALGLEVDAAVCLRQVHGDLIVDADALGEIDWSSPPVGDGLVTRASRRLIGVGVADCAPLFLVFPGGQMVLHAGWRGVVARILPCALEMLKRRWDFDPTSVEVMLGPCIGPCCFGVSAAVAALFPPHVRRRHGARHHVDLPGALFDQWLSSGGRPASFMRRDRCTVCGSPSLYSHRRAPNRGRNFAFIYRLENAQATPI